MKLLRSSPVLLVLLLVVCLSVPGGYAAAAQEVPSLPGQFAYVESGSRLYLVRGNVNEAVLLVQTSQGSTVANPRFSRDGRYLAYCIHDTNADDHPLLYYLDTLTLEKFEVTREGSCSFDWWMDGKTLVFTTPPFLEGEMTMDQGIWSYTLETGALEVLIPTDSPVIDPRWSPDGRTLSYFGFCFECVGPFYTYDLITKVIMEWSPGSSDWYPGPDMDWSPDGKSFVSDKALWMYTHEGETYGLHLVSSDGEIQKEIHSLPGRAAHFPIWSPDGKRIAFASFESFTIGNYLNRRGDLMTVAPDGSSAKKLYSSTFEVFPQAWSPDGRYLLFVEPLSVMQDPLQKQQLVLLDMATGSPLWKLSSFDAITADWAPLPAPIAPAKPSIQMAGQAGMLFVSTDYALAFYEPVTDQVQKLTASFSGTDFSISPDGRTVLFGDQIVSVSSQADGTVSVSVIESPHPRDFYNITWSSDGQKYGFVDEDGSAWVVDVLGNRQQLPDGESPPRWSFDGRWMAYCDKVGRLWIAQTGKPADWIIQRENCSVHWSPTQSILAYVTYPDLDLDNFADGTAFLYDPISGRTREIAQAISGLSWSPDGKLVGLSRITTMGASNYAYTVTVINPETGQELLIDEFHAEMYENTGWIEQADSYLFGKYRFQADVLLKEPVSDILFDSTRDGGRLLVGSGGNQSLEIGCREAASDAYHPLLNVTLSDTPGAAMPGLRGQFSPDGEWILISDYVEDGTVNWLARCEAGEPLRLPRNAWLFDQYFSPDSAWLIAEETHPFKEMISQITVQDLESNSIREIQAGLNTDSAWFRMPEPPAVPSSTLSEETQPAVSVTPIGRDGPIHLQSDTPNVDGRSLLFLLLLWSGALAVFVILVYVFWKRSVAANKQEEPVIHGKKVEAGPVIADEPALKPSPEEVETAFREGVEWVRAGKAVEGITELHKVIAAAPENEDAWFWLAIAAVRQKSYRTAERCFLQAKKHGHPEADRALEWLRKQGN
jgi:Tol biopolymer transport system component